MFYNLIAEPKPIQFLKGVGPSRAKAFHKTGIFHDVDLLFYFPRSYVNRSSLLTIKQVYGKILKDNFFIQEPNSLDFKEEVTILGKVVEKEIRTTRDRKKYLVVKIQDFNGDFANLIYWQYPDYYEKYFEINQFYIIYGIAELGIHNEITFHHPETERFDQAEQFELQKGTTIPIYPLNSYFKSAKINNRILRKIISESLKESLHKIEDILSNEIIKQLGYKDLHYTIENLHFPQNPSEIPKLFERFKFTEALVFEIFLALNRQNQKLHSKAPIFDTSKSIIKEFHSSLQFELTNDQKKVIKQIFDDLKSGKPMNRLLQGDVGSGKTIVAIFAMLLAKANNFQSAIMAPTEILAEQHYLTLKNLLKDFPIHIELVVGSQNAKHRNSVAKQISDYKVDIIVGTHALFEGNLEFARLGLVIVDEQHRFGVEQRSRLRELAAKSLGNGFLPHLLVMSATPIPRTLAMTLYGDLDVSTIKELPQGRKPIITKIVYESNLDKMYEFIRKQIKKGRQAYFVYPLIEKSEKIDIKSASEHWELLQNEIFPEFRCGLLHGRMKAEEKEETMQRFKRGEYNILVSTTVIEVGIDVPNATIMVIENAERFGLSQLHQLRGRVGRGSIQSYCFLVTDDKYNSSMQKTLATDSESKSVVVRLKTMESTTDGFQIAEVDLQLRGPGDILGKQQSGLPPFKYINLAYDGEIISTARKVAFEILKYDPNFTKHQKLKKFLDLKMTDKNYFGVG